MTKDVRDKVRDYLAERLAAKGDTKPFEDNDSLFTSGRLDSLDAVETAATIEQEFGVDFDALGVGAAPLDSVETIIEMVEDSKKDKK